MTPAESEEEIEANCEYEDVLADLFHALSQPLTTLQCCLAGSLQKKQFGGRNQIEIALQQTKSVVFLTEAIRQLVTCEAGSGQPASDLSACVREVVGDLLPVANAGKLELRLTCRGSCFVRMEASRLRQATFCLVESALNQSQPGSAIGIAVKAERSEVELTVRILAPSRNKRRVSRTRSAANNSDLRRRLTLAIARRTFERATGTFQIHRELRQTTLRIRLPRSDQEPALPLVSSSRRCG